jgi:hypothetical protein
MDQFSLNALRKKPRINMGAGIGVQSSGKGDRSIKRVDRSYMTYEKINTDKATRSILDQQQEHFNRTEGNRGYGSLIRAEGQVRNSDRVAGDGVRLNALGGSRGAAGRAYGGTFEGISAAAVDGDEIRESLLVNTEGRRGLQKQQVRRIQQNQDSIIDAATFAPASVFQRGDNMAPGAIMERYIKTTVKPTETYTQLGQYSTHSSFGIDYDSVINDKHISYEASSGKDTQGTFNKYAPDEVKGIIERIHINGNSGKQHIPVYEKEHFHRKLDPKIKIEGKSGEQYLPKYEEEHLLKDLTPKISAKDVMASQSTTRNNARVDTEQYVRLRPNKPNVDIRSATTNNIKKDTNTYKENYTIKHRRPNLNGFFAGDKSSIPTF